MKPFDGVTFCCTSIPLKLREDIATKITALGGVHYNDLMSDVNYLIVGDRRTDKYRFCINNRYDVKFIPPGAIQKIHTQWLDGQDVSNSLEESILAVFDGLIICVSRIAHHENSLDKETFRAHSDHRIDDVFDTNKMTSWISSHGGTVTDSLTVSNSCVITTETRGKRYLKALEWNIPVVHPVWVFDSLLRAAALDYNDYSLKDQPHSYSSGCKVWDKWLQNSIRRPKPNSTTLQMPVKPTRKDPGVWQSIMQNQALRAPSLTHKNAWEENEEEPEDEAAEEIVSEAVHTAQEQQPGLFADFVFAVVGFLSRQALLVSKVITSNGGSIVGVSSKTITHILLPSKTSNQASLLLESIPDSTRDKTVQGLIEIVTEWFIERCLFYGKVMLDNWGKPLRGLFTSTELFKICITGFTGIELLHLEKLINYLNFEYCDTLTSNRDLLVFNINVFKSSLQKNSPKLFEYPTKDVLDCPIYQQGATSVSVTSSRNKIKAAKQWNIPIVSIAYVWEIVLQSRLPSIHDLAWCLYAPGNAKPNSMLDYVKSNMETTPKKRRDQSIKFPSPRRNSKRQKFGRIVGRGSPVTERLLHESRNEEQEEDENDITNIDELQDDVVGYQNTKSLQDSEKLLRKLAG